MKIFAHTGVPSISGRSGNHSGPDWVSTVDASDSKAGDERQPLQPKSSGVEHCRVRELLPTSTFHVSPCSQRVLLQLNPLSKNLLLLLYTLKTISAEKTFAIPPSRQHDLAC